MTTSNITKNSNNLLSDPYAIGLCVSIFATFMIWFVLQMTGTQDGFLNKLFAFMLAVTPFFASFKGFSASKKWGRGSVIGKSIITLSIGLFLWSIGEILWTYYIVFENNAVPYPSWADAGYATGVIFWIISTLYLAKLAGVGILLKSRPALKVIVPVIVAASLALSYYLLVTVARQGEVTSSGSSVLKVIFDFAYPLTDVISLTVISVVITVSGRYLGGTLLKPISFVIVGMFFSYLYDLSFSYTTTKDTYFNGHPNDLLLLIATSLLSLALVFYSKQSILNLSRTTKESEATPSQPTPTPIQQPAPVQDVSSQPEPVKDGSGQV